MLQRIATALIVLLALAGAGPQAWAQEMVGSEFLVNTTIAGNQQNPAGAGLSGGGFIVT
jgi:hypothetical protein